MFKNIQCHLLILSIVFCFLLLFSSIKCEDERIKQLLIENKLQTSTVNNRLNHFLHKQQQQDLSSHSNEDHIKQLINDLFRIYPHRRASSFHAMRGKRSIQTI